MTPLPLFLLHNSSSSLLLPSLWHAAVWVAALFWVCKIEEGHSRLLLSDEALLSLSLLCSLVLPSTSRLVSSAALVAQKIAVVCRWHRLLYWCLHLSLILDNIYRYVMGLLAKNEYLIYLWLLTLPWSKNTDLHTSLVLFHVQTATSLIGTVTNKVFTHAWLIIYENSLVSTYRRKYTNAWSVRTSLVHFIFSPHLKSSYFYFSLLSFPFSIIHLCFL